MYTFRFFLTGNVGLVSTTETTVLQGYAVTACMVHTSVTKVPVYLKSTLNGTPICSSLSGAYTAMIGI